MSTISLDGSWSYPVSQHHLCSCGGAIYVGQGRKEEAGSLLPLEMETLHHPVALGL